MSVLNFVGSYFGYDRMGFISILDSLFWHYPFQQPPDPSHAILSKYLEKYNNVITQSCILTVYLQLLCTFGTVNYLT